MGKKDKQSSAILEKYGRLLLKQKTALESELPYELSNIYVSTFSFSLLSIPKFTQAKHWLHYCIVFIIKFTLLVTRRLELIS